MDKNELTPDDARELGRKVAEAWLFQRSAIAAFVEGVSGGLQADTTTLREDR